MNLARSSFYLTTTNLVLSVLTALNFFFLAALLSAKQLGVLSILLAIPSIGFCLFSAGYHKAAIYYVGRKEYALETVLTNGILFCLFLEIVLGLLLLAFGTYLAQSLTEISFGLFCFAVLSTPVQMFLFYLTDTCIAAEKIGITLWARSFSPVVYVLGCLVAGMSGHLSAGTAFVFYIAGICAAVLTGLGQVIFQSQEKRLFRPHLPTAIRCLKFGGQAQLGELAQYLAMRIDLLLVGFWAGVEASGYYSVATRLAETIWLIAYSLQPALSAKVARSSQETRADKGRRLERSVRYIATISLAVGVGIVGLSYVIFTFFLARYQPSLQLLLALAPGQVALAMFFLMVGNLVGDGHPLLATKLQVALLILSLLFYVTLIPTLGALGAGLATSVAYLISAILTALLTANMYQIKLLDFLRWKKEDWEYFKTSKQYLSRYFAA